MKYRLFGHIFFLILIIMAGFFCLERILYADSAFQFFKIINFESFNIEAVRYSTVLTQILTLLAIKINIGLKSLILIYSVSFILIYYMVYLLNIYVFKDVSAGVLLLLVLVLGIRSSFFHPVTETHQGLVYSTLFYAWLFSSYEQKGNRVRRILIILTGLFIVILCYFSHPVTFLVILYIIASFLIEKNHWKDTGMYILVIGIILSWSLRAFLTPADSYEGQYYSSIRNGIIFKQFFVCDSFKFLVQNLDRLYYFHILIAILVIVNYLIQRVFLKLVFYLMAILIFIFVTVLTYYKGDSPMSMEKNFMPLSLFICLPFIREIIFGSVRFQFMKLIFITIILGVSLFNIFSESSLYKSRLYYLDRMIRYSEKFHEKKFIIEKENLDMDKIMIPWALSVETLLYSSLESPDRSATFYMTEDAGTFHYDENNPELFLCTDFWLNWRTGDLNEKYFRLPKGEYKLVPVKIR